jgi:hypothetical protein
MDTKEKGWIRLSKIEPWLLRTIGNRVNAAEAEKAIRVLEAVSGVYKACTPNPAASTRDFILVRFA